MPEIILPNVDETGAFTSQSVWDRITERVGGGARTGAWSGVKHIPLSLTRGASNTLAAITDEAVRFPLHFGAPVHRFRVHARNWNSRHGTVQAESVTITGLWVGAGDTATGAYSETPAQVGDTVTTPADGSEWVSDWIDYPIDPDTGHLLSIGITTPADQDTTTTLGTCWRTVGATNATGAPGAASTTVPLDWWIEAETPAITPVLAVYGDSISSYGGTRPVIDSWLSIYAREHGYLPVHHSWPGSGMIESVGWGRTHHFTMYKGGGLARPDAVVHFMGQNDLGSAGDLATMQSRFLSTLPYLRDNISDNVHAATITPNSGRPADQQAIAEAYNDWLFTLPDGIKSVQDYALAVGDAEGDALLPAYDGDGLHPNAAGYQAIAAATAGNLTSPHLATAGDLAAIAVQDSGWRSLNVATGSTARTGTGSIQIRRIGDRVRCRFRDVGIADGAGAGVVLLSSELTGFGCDIVGQFMFVGNASGTTRQNWLRFNYSLWWTLSRDHLGGTTTRTGVSLSGEVVWYTTDAWPTTLPGTAV